VVTDNEDILRIERSIERLTEKFDIQDTKYMSRTEYEARNATLQNELSKLSLEITRKDTWVQSEHNDIRKEMAARFEKVSVTLDAIEDKFSQDTQKLRDEIAQSSTDKWKLIATSLLGLITGGGILYIVELVRAATHV
jgi:malate synthase